MISVTTTMTPVTLLRAVHCDELAVREFVQPAGLSIPTHEHAEATILFVVGGEVTDRFGSRQHTVGPGQLLARPAAEPHAHHYGSAPVHCVALSVEPALVERLRDTTLDLRTVAQRPAPAMFEVLRRELAFEPPAPGLLLEGRLIEALTSLRDGEATRSGPVPRWLLRVQELLHESGGANVRLGELAAVAGVHEGHLTRAFRTWFRCSIGEYARQRQVARAARQLAESERPIADVALDCGFYDQSHLNRVFRRALGTTPLAWRQMRGSFKSA